MMDDMESEKILLSPLGLSPGLLYSALMTIKPERLIVLTSKEGKASLGEIIHYADYAGKVQVITVDDPFNCFAEAGAKVAQIVDLLIEDSGGVAGTIYGEKRNLSNFKITVNLTGGTTALQFIIQRAGAELERSGCAVSYVALVDRRGVLAQRSNPWVVGELIKVM